MWTAEAGGGGNYISGVFFFKDSTGKGGFLYVTLDLSLQFSLSSVIYRCGLRVIRMALRNIPSSHYNHLK